tara:strand:- start:210 stop:317 length:108 start_codon:yes stop_codon:yes gene_type:complete
MPDEEHYNIIDFIEQESDKLEQEKQEQQDINYIGE